MYNVGFYSLHWQFGILGRSRRDFADTTSARWNELQQQDPPKAEPPLSDLKAAKPSLFHRGNTLDENASEASVDCSRQSILACYMTQYIMDAQSLSKPSRIQQVEIYLAHSRERWDRMYELLNAHPADYRHR